METFDFVIVGAGSAGCAMAYRLSEDGKNSVCVLEYGGSDRGPFIQMPSALSYPMNMNLYNWGFESDPEPGLGGRRLATPRGKVVGGSSSINGGEITGNSTFNDTSLLDGSGYPTLDGTITLNDYSSANGSWFVGVATFNDYASLTQQYNVTPACVFNDYTTCAGLAMSGGATFNDFSVCSAVSFSTSVFTFNDSATGGVTVSGSGYPEVIYNDNSYGSGNATSLFIVGASAMQNASLFAGNPTFNYSFTRPKYGINGSSILGIV